MSFIFRNTAPSYWAKGLPAIPLLANTKKPVTEAWQQYSHSMPSKEVQDEWLERFARGNIGLPMGEQSGLVAIDVDTDDAAVAEILARVLPPSPWHRRGKKGIVQIYRWNRHKTFRIRTLKGESILEMLSSGTQIVLPPSIHPDTQQPYTANCNLVDVMDQIQALPVDIESKLRRELSEAGYDLSTKGYTKVTEVVSVGARDTKMTSVAGIMAKGVMRGERTLLEALSEMVAWVDNFTVPVAGDSMDPQKAVNKVLEFMLRDIQNAGRQLPEGWSRGMTDADKARFAIMFGEENEAWGCQRVLDHLLEAFEENSSLTDRNFAVEMALMKVATNDKMTGVEADVVIDFIVKASGKMFSKSALRKRVIELKRGPTPGENHAEVADLFLKEVQTGGEIRYHNGRFLQWRGCHWEPMEKQEVMRTLAKEFGGLPAMRKNSDHEGVFRMLSSVIGGGFERSKVKGINFANGFLTTDLKLLPHDPEYGCTYVMPYNYQPGGEGGHCQRFLSFLYQSWGHNDDCAEKVQALREALGATLFGLAPLYQRAFCLIGVPHSGKSVLMNIIQSLLPENSASHVPPSMWGDKFMPVLMDGKLANFCGELSESDVIPGDTFKSIIDAEEMSGQFKGRDIFFFRPACAQWFSSNHLPRTRDSSAGFSRRWLFLHFDKPVKESDKIVGLASEIVAEEQEAIVSWALSSVPGLMARNTFQLPASHIKMTIDLGGMNNSVRQYLTKGNLEFLADKSEDEIILHADYNVFCREIGARPVALPVFRQRLTEMMREFNITVEDAQVRGVKIYARVRGSGT